ncbi:telomeric repeat-binding factor 2-like isoform X2 [Pimephales promelas]|uniref:telomeric repeat-binding factor 2-like isoform X2 n=1 Tax=Pimephales promelas TaxID=90988 RepID=UPI0019555D75|nr:telomeric repeat-binding factor 2-like isoform X2 [Pimephales promelas]KAG1927649.1 telomeric repeat-binding factor [Pimephales promelas]
MSEDERIINRWFFDVCVFKALESFRNGDYTDFAKITNVIESMVVLPMDGRGDTVLKLRCMQFLSRVNNGDKLDLTFEEPKTPLESALAVLESLCRELDVPQREQQRVHNAITEMLIVVCIRGGEFEKAEEVLHRHFSTAADSAGKKKLLASLIQRRRSSHSVLQLISYSDFKQDMLEFIERLYRVPEPFLTQMLKRSGHLRLSAEPTTTSSSSSLSPSRGGRSSPQKPSTAAAEDHGGVCCVSLQSVRQVYGELCEECGASVPFSRLLEEVELEAQQPSRESPEAELHLALSETPMEPAERLCALEPRVTLRRYTGMTISRLVTEEDSQLSGDDSQDISRISGCAPLQRSPQRLIIHSDPESEDIETVRRKSTEKKRDDRLIIHSDPESEDIETVRRKSTDNQRDDRVRTESHETPGKVLEKKLSVRHSGKKTHNSRRVVLSSGEECEDPPSDRHAAGQEPHDSSDPECVLEERAAPQSSTPAHHSRTAQSDHSGESRSTPSVRRSGKKTHNSRSVVLSSDEECEDPPSDRHAAGQEPHDSSDPECVLEECAAPQSSTPAHHSRTAQSDHSESEVHSTRPQVRSSPADSRSSSSGKRSAKRAPWQDASGVQEDWSDEESLFGTASGPSHKKTKRYTRKLWTVQESDWLKEGVRRFGVGHWEPIRCAFPFTGRTACNLKDRWRTMVKLKMV